MDRGTGLWDDKKNRILLGTVKTDLNPIGLNTVDTKIIHVCPTLLSLEVVADAVCQEVGNV